jgi:hypothetical protein
MKNTGPRVYVVFERKRIGYLLQDDEVVSNWSCRIQRMFWEERGLD